MKQTSPFNNYEHALLAFNLLPVGDTCQWPGTKYEGIGKDAVLQPCGSPAVGKGLFADPGNIMCAAVDVCERHSNNGRTKDWGNIDQDEFIWGSLYA